MSMVSELDLCDQGGCDKYFVVGLHQPLGQCCVSLNCATQQILYELESCNQSGGCVNLNIRQVLQAGVSAKRQAKNNDTIVCELSATCVR